MGVKHRSTGKNVKTVIIIIIASGCRLSASCKFCQNHHVNRHTIMLCEIHGNVFLIYR